MHLPDLPIARRSSLLLALAGLVFASEASADPSSTTPEQGYELGEMQHPRAMAMAGAQQALGGSTTAIYLNPANLALYRMYHLEALATFSPEARRQSYGGAIADSSTNRLAGGFAGTWSSLDPDGIKRTWTDLRMALAYPLGDRVSVGLTGRYLRLNQGLARGPLGASLVSDGTPGGPLFNGFTFDAGVGVSPIDSLRIGLSGRNLTAPGTGLAPTVLAGGVGYTNSIFTVEADGHADFTTWKSTRGRAMIGGEILIADHFPVRAGYRYDDGTRAHAVTAGAGYVDRRFAVDLGMRRDVSADFPVTYASLALRMFYDAMGSGESTDAGF